MEALLGHCSIATRTLLEGSNGTWPLECRVFFGQSNHPLPSPRSPTLQQSKKMKQQNKTKKDIAPTMKYRFNPTAMLIRWLIVAPSWLIIFNQLIRAAMECGARTFVGGVAQHSLGGGALLDCYLDVIVCNELITTESVVGHRLNVAGMNERRFGNKETDRQTDR